MPGFSTNKIVLISSIIGFALCPLSTYVFQEFLHIPISLPEILYLPLLLKYGKGLGFVNIKLINYVGIFYLWALLLLLGILMNSWSLYSILSTSHSFFFLFIFICIGYHVKPSELLFKSLFYISTSSLIGWLICSFIDFGIKLGGERGNEAIYGNMIAISYCISIALFYFKTNYAFVISVILNLLLAFTTGLRRQMLSLVVSLSASWALILIKHFKLRRMLVVFMLVGAFMYVLPTVEDFISESSPLLYVRTFEKTRVLLEGEIGHADNTRVSNLDLMEREFLNIIIPRGFVSLQTLSDEGTGTFIDAPYYMLSYSFGIITFLLFVVIYIGRLLMLIKQYIKNGNRSIGVVITASSVIFFLLFVDATMFSYSYTAPITGLALGMHFKKIQSFYEE